MNPSTALACVVVDELLRGGVRDVVLAPGSRSAALALELHRLDAEGRLRLHVRVDERTAGFLAIGLARTGGRAVAVVTTSGTAVANLHPAVLEASHAGLPLLVLCADRPALLRGSGANQTTDQVALFGSAARLAVDLPPPARDTGQVAGWRAVVSRAVATALGARTRDPGPVQLNLQFAEPLTPDPTGPPYPTGPADPAGEDWPEPLAGRAGGQPWSRVEAAAPTSTHALVLDGAVPTVVVAGDAAGPPARLLAQSAGWPLLAEPTSGARTGDNALRCYRLLLGGRLAARIERVVVFGHPTLSRPVATLLARADVETVVVSPHGPTWTDPGHVAATVVGATRADGTADPRWLQAWRAADARAAAAVDTELGAGLGPYAVARAVADAVGPEALLVVGSSNPVRDLDLMAAPFPVGERRKVIGNRGLSGIDGTVSTAVGAALARRSSRALAYLGDLALLHDANGLLLGPDEPRPDLTIVVANDDGGSIFATLEQGGAGHAGAFERVFGTPHGADLGALCAASGTSYRRCETLPGLRAALAAPGTGIEVLEVPVDRAERRRLDQRLATVGAEAAEAAEAVEAVD